MEAWPWDRNVNFGGGHWWVRQRQHIAWNCHMHQILRFSGSSNRYDPRIFGTRLNGAFVSSNIVALRYARQRPSFVFASAGFVCQCRPLHSVNRVTLTAEAPPGEYQSSLYLSLELHLAPDVEPRACHGNAGKIDSSLLSNEVIYNYGANTESLLSNIILPTDALLCKDCNCTNDSQKAALNQLYDNVLAAITMASQNSMHTHGVMLLIYMILDVYPASLRFPSPTMHQVHAICTQSIIAIT